MWSPRIKILFIVLYFYFSPKSFCQEEHFNWFYGHLCGLSFQGNSVSNQNLSNMYTEECSAAISDDFGNLLFYTNGQEVFNKNYTLMPNGSGILGHVSSA